MMEGPQGFDLSSGMWENRGWRQIDALRRKLERLKELRELVRSLGRAGGRGPRRRAPEEVRRRLSCYRHIVQGLKHAEPHPITRAVGGQQFSVRARSLASGHCVQIINVRIYSLPLRLRRVRLPGNLSVGRCIAEA